MALQKLTQIEAQLVTLKLQGTDALVREANAEYQKLKRYSNGQ